jgi:hypothetical protein
MRHRRNPDSPRGPGCYERDGKVPHRNRGSLAPAAQSLAVSGCCADSRQRATEVSIRCRNAHDARTGEDRRQQVSDGIEVRTLFAASSGSAELYDRPMSEVPISSSSPRANQGLVLVEIEPSGTSDA